MHLTLFRNHIAISPNSTKYRIEIPIFVRTEQKDQLRALPCLHIIEHQLSHRSQIVLTTGWSRLSTVANDRHEERISIASTK